MIPGVRTSFFTPASDRGGVKSGKARLIAVRRAAEIPIGHRTRFAYFIS